VFLPEIDRSISGKNTNYQINRYDLDEDAVISRCDAKHTSSASISKQLWKASASATVTAAETGDRGDEAAEATAASDSEKNKVISYGSCVGHF
jgi:putative Ca2+/H+ antiporter (TMEM165/GDT1 family)